MHLPETEVPSFLPSSLPSNIPLPFFSMYLKTLGMVVEIFSAFGAGGVLASLDGLIAHSSTTCYFFILVLLLINYYIIFHMNNYKPTFAHPC